MKNKKLEQVFLDYVNSIAGYGSDAHASEDEEMWLLFAQEDFHVNKKMNTLYVKPIDVLIENVFKLELIDIAKPQWVAYQQNPLTLQDKITVGFDNPFMNPTLASMKNGRSIVRAVPFQYAKRMHKQANILK